MIKADEVKYEPIFYDWLHGKWTNQRKMKRKWYVRVGGYYAIGKNKAIAYKKAKKLYCCWQHSSEQGTFRGGINVRD